MQQNVKNALVAIEYLHKKHLDLAFGLESKVKDWENSNPKSLALSIVSSQKQYAKNMSDLKSLLVTKPKKRKIESKKSN